MLFCDDPFLRGAGVGIEFHPDLHPTTPMRVSLGFELMYPFLFICDKEFAMLQLFRLDSICYDQAEFRFIPKFVHSGLSGMAKCWMLPIRRVCFTE